MAGDTRGQVGEKQFIPILQRGEPERRREIDPRPPFLRVHRQLARTRSARGGLHGVSPPYLLACANYVWRGLYCPSPPPHRKRAEWCAADSLQPLRGNGGQRPRCGGNASRLASTARRLRPFGLQAMLG